MSVNTQSENQNQNQNNSKNTQLYELQEQMSKTRNQIAYEFCYLKKSLENISDILEDNFNEAFINNNFDYQELIEEQFDQLFYKYNKVKELLKKGREIRYYTEIKEKNNILSHYTIKST